jgi:hypothetical protein
MRRPRRHGLPKSAVPAMLLCSGVAVSVLCATSAMGGAAPLPAPEQKYLGMILGDGRYLEGWLGLERSAGKPGADPDAIALARSFVLGGSVDYRPADEDCEAGSLQSALSGAQPSDAIGEIVERAKRSRVVILNENHSTPRHRAFALQLARALRPLGYRHLAAEAINDRMTDDAAAAATEKIRRRGYIVRSDGIYTNEAMFADFLKQALGLGYRLHSYDGNPPGAVDPVAAREEWQAQTIARRVIVKYPEDKVLIYVGFRHATEIPFDGGLGRRESWMATRLARITGLDPLTIDQRQPVPQGCLPGRLVSRVMRASPTGSVVFKKNGRDVGVGDYAGVVDLNVLHFPVPAVRSRPGWMAALGRRAVEVPKGLLAKDKHSLVELHVKGSSPDAIALDRVLVRPGERNPPPLLTSERDIEIRVQAAPPSAP